MEWDSLRQGASFGVLSGLVKLVAGVVVIVFVVRATLRRLRFPDRFIDDEHDEASPPHDDALIPEHVADEARDDRVDADGEDDR